MNIDLSNFETIIEEQTIERGLAYYQHEAVQEIEQVAKNEFSAIVEGSEDYNVYIQLDENLHITTHSCDCPYEWGDYCKHKVAVLYSIKNEELHKKAPDEKGKFQLMREKLASLEKEEIIQIILNVSKKNKKMRDEILWELGFEVDEF